MNSGVWRLIRAALIVVALGLLWGLLVAYPFQFFVTVVVLAVLSPFFIIGSWL